MSNFLNGPRFLGTKAPYHSDLSLVLILISVILLTAGFVLARQKRYTAHRWVQTAAVVVNAAVVLSVMVASFAVYILPGLPARLLEGSYGVTTLHALVGGAGLLFGVFVALRGNELVPRRLRFRNYKLFMRTAYGLYLAAALLGVLVYYEAYVLGI